MVGTINQVRITLKELNAIRNPGTSLSYLAQLSGHKILWKKVAENLSRRLSDIRYEDLKIFDRDCVLRAILLTKAERFNGSAVPDFISGVSLEELNDLTESNSAAVLRELLNNPVCNNSIRMAVFKNAFNFPYSGLDVHAVEGMDMKTLPIGNIEILSKSRNPKVLKILIEPLSVARESTDVGGTYRREARNILIDLANGGVGGEEVSLEAYNILKDWDLDFADLLLLSGSESHEVARAVLLHPNFPKDMVPALLIPLLIKVVNGATIGKAFTTSLYERFFKPFGKDFIDLMSEEIKEVINRLRTEQELKPVRDKLSKMEKLEIIIGLIKEWLRSFLDKD